MISVFLILCAEQPFSCDFFIIFNNFSFFLSTVNTTGVMSFKFWPHHHNIKISDK